MGSPVSTPTLGTVVGFAFVTPRGERFESESLNDVFSQAREMGQESGTLYAVIQPEGQDDRTEEQRISAHKGDHFVKLACACGKTEWVPRRSSAHVTRHSYQCESCSARD